ncbi:protein of unknown function [Methylocella tundrae]|uniref:Uncharacterized protein n=1 Tax=Methylocella tundrae TaxID=227605 RepID=A0A4U8Z080_METTU|nr:protein of unknown function [Methylocella tundrae]
MRPNAILFMYQSDNSRGVSGSLAQAAFT